MIAFEQLAEYQNIKIQIAILESQKAMEKKLQETIVVENLFKGLNLDRECLSYVHCTKLS